MQILIDIGNAVNNVMGIFGSTIIVPIVIFIISMCMRVGVKKSFQGAIYMAVGLTLFNAVLGVLMTAITVCNCNGGYCRYFTAIHRYRMAGSICSRLF